MYCNLKKKKKQGINTFRPELYLNTYVYKMKWVLKYRKVNITEDQYHSPWLGDKVDYGLGLSYRPVRLHRLAGRSDNLMPKSTLSPGEGLWIWLLDAMKCGGGGGGVAFGLQEAYIPHINLFQLEIYMGGDNQELWFLIWSTSPPGGGEQQAPLRWCCNLPFCITLPPPTHSPPPAS